MSKSVWAISDGAAGNERQACALASRLGDITATLRVRPRWPWASLVPQFSPVLAASAWRDPWPSPWPEIAVGAGRLGAGALLTIRRAAPTRTVQILDPRIDTARFDVVVAPTHDGLRGDNVVQSLGSLHDINDAWLKRERIAHAPLSRLASPRTVILLGGPRRGVTINAASFTRLTNIVEGWRRHGTLLLIASRRTPADWLRALDAIHCDLRWSSEADGPNPYRGALAWGDRFIVTADSVNMQSEALATGKPVYSLCEKVPLGKLGDFHRELVETGRLRPLRAEPAQWRYQPLRELDRVATEVTALLAR